VTGAAHAASQAWPAFVLVSGLLLVGVAAEQDGLFAAAGAALARLPGSTVVLYITALGLVALVTAVLNLDTSVVFLTAVLIHVARARGLDEAPFVYGAVLMSNAASLYLPGSNLTNLIVLHDEHVSGLTFFLRMWPAAAAATLATTVVLLALFRRELSSSARRADEIASARIAAGAVGVACATVLVLVLAQPALPVLAIGVAAMVFARVTRARIAAVVDPRVLGGLFALAVLLGAAGRWWTGPAEAVGALGRGGTALAGAIGALCLNNLPAAVLLTPHPPAHPRALLVGLNLGPNLAVTGSLSAFLWLRIARGLGADASAARYSRLGLVVVPASMGAALGALWLLAPGRI
jgi:arsenical pump membrane protein